jgi:ATP-dependent DNA helicase RecG
MDKQRLREIIEGGESTEIELKRSFHSNQEFSKIICAFANSQGGVVIVGINPDKSIEGVNDNLDELQRRISDSSSNIHPRPTMEIEQNSIDNKNIIVIKVHKADSSVFHSFEGAIYVRIGSTTQKLEGDSILEFLRNRQILLFDEGLEYSAKLESIDKQKIEEYLNSRNQSGYLNAHSIKDFLISKKLAVNAPDFKIKNATLLFFAKEPQQFFPYAQIKLVRFEGTEPIKVISYEEAKGNFPQIIRHAVSFIQRFTSKEFIIGGIKREEKLVIPIEAVREAIINAVAHRDYFNKNEIQISIFDDRIEITNPGGLPDGMEREMLGILSVQRNPLIYQLLKDYGFMEGIGSGIARIYSTMQNANLRKPEFFLSKEIFRITLRIRRSEEVELAAKLNLNNRQSKALDYLRINKRISSKEYSRINKISVAYAVRELNRLIELKLIKKMGKYRGAYYTIKD